MLEKIKTRINIETIDINDIHGSLEEVIKLFEDLKDEQYESIVVESDTDFYDGDEGYANLEIYGTRLETDKELENRQNSVNKLELDKYLKEQAAIIKEKETYIQLKEKYKKELG